MADVELNVRTQLTRIAKELQEISEVAGKVGNNLKGAGEKIGDSIDGQVKKTERGLAQLQSFSGRVASQLISDFKALASINAIGGALKISNQFSGAAREALSLNDAVRKTSDIFGIAESRRSVFMANLMKGFGAIGASSEAAANAVNGLSQTTVRGESTIQSYAETAAKLASISQEKGGEGGIAKGLAGLAVARGGSANDLGQLSAGSSEVLRIRAATGKSVTEILGSMNQLFAHVNESFKGAVRGGAGTTLATAALVGGSGATAFLERYLKMDAYERQGAQAQGLGRIIGPNGALNSEAMESTLREARGRGMGNAAAGLKTMGLSAEEAQGFIRLTEAMRNREERAMIMGAKDRHVDLNAQYGSSMGFGEAFRANINQVKGAGARLIAPITQGASDALQDSAKSPWKSAGVVAAAGTIAAVLGSFGLRGAGKALGLGGLAAGAATEAITGRKVQPVFVVNAKDLGGGIGGAAGLMGFLANPILAGGLALGAGGAAGSALANSSILKGTTGKTSEGYEGDIIDRLIFKLDKLMQGNLTGAAKNNPIANSEIERHKIIIEAKSRDFTTKYQPPLGPKW